MDKIVINIPKYARTYGNVQPKYYTIRKGVAGMFSRTGKCQKPLPKKYIANAQYIWKPRGNVKVLTLFDVIANAYVIANEREVKTGHQIKGQINNTGRQHDGIRKSTFKAIKTNVWAHLKNEHIVPESWYPVRVDIVLHDTVANPFDDKNVLSQTWDVDNHCAIYKKVVLDALVNTVWEKREGDKRKCKYTACPSAPRILVDDDRFFVSRPLCYWEPLNVEETDKRFMQIIIRPELKHKEHPLFLQKHGRAAKVVDPQLNLF